MKLTRIGVLSAYEQLGGRREYFARNHNGAKTGVGLFLKKARCYYNEHGEMPRNAARCLPGGPTIADVLTRASI